MKQEMILIGLAESTQAIYLKSIIELRNYYNKSPTKLTEQEIKAYLLYLKKEKKLAPNDIQSNGSKKNFWRTLPVLWS